MSAAWLLTVVALLGVFAGAHLDHIASRSAMVGAAGAGLLFGICLFWLMPEIAGNSTWVSAVVLPLVMCSLLIALDRLLTHTGHSPRQGVIGPLLAATAVHSFLDGWSVRALAIQPFAQVAVPIGLALHKLPEGLALGWANRRALKSRNRAFLSGAMVEALTLVGAWAEPSAARSGIDTFGPRWTAIVLASVAGSFLFLGFHSIVPERKKAGVVPVFLVTFAVLGILAFANGAGQR